MYQRRSGPDRSRQLHREAPSSPRDKGHWMAVGDLLVRVALPTALPLPARPALGTDRRPQTAFRAGLAQGKEAGRARGRADARHIAGTWLSHNLVEKNVMVYADRDRDRLGQAGTRRPVGTVAADRQESDAPAELIRPDSPETVLEIVRMGASVRRGRGEPTAVHAEAYRLGAVGAYRTAWLNELAEAVLRSALADTALVADGVRTSALRRALATHARANRAAPTVPSPAPPTAGQRPMAELRGAPAQSPDAARPGTGAHVGPDQRPTPRPGTRRAPGPRGPSLRHSAALDL